MSRPFGSNKFSLKHVAEALEKASGVPALAAQILTQTTGKGCHPRTVREYLKRYPELGATIEESVETALDLAESKLLQALSKGDRWAVCFYLETKGKSRGYTRRHEIAGISGKPIEITDARERLIAELSQMGERLTVPNGNRPVASRKNRHVGPTRTVAPAPKTLQ